MIDHCEYTLLGIPVTDNTNLIKEAFERNLMKYKNYENSEDPSKRQDYKTIMAAGAALYSPGNKRQKIIQEHKDALLKFLPYMLEPVIKQKQSSISEDYYNSMKSLATDENGAYHFDEILAKDVIDGILNQHGITVGGSFNIKPPSDPRLIDNFSITPQKEGLKLTWDLPNQDCDRVVIRRSYTNFPENENSGESIFDGKGQEVLDKKIQAGKKVFYSAFSFYLNRFSTAKVTREGFFAEGVRDVQLIECPGKIELNWKSPKAKYKSIILFRSAPDRELKISYQDGVPMSGGNDTKRITISENKNQYIDKDICHGKTYHYCIVVDYGSIDHTHFFSEGQTTSGSPIPFANPTKNLRIISQDEGLMLTWENPKEYCDSIKIVRKESKFPEDETDGVIVYTGTDTAVKDTAKLKAGYTYHYKIFSIYQGFASANVSMKKLYAGDVKDLRIPEPIAGCIHLKWIPPDLYEKIHLFRSKGYPPKVIFQSDIPGGEYDTQINLPKNRLSEHTDKGVIPGEEYHYLIIVQYPDGQYSKGKIIKGFALEPALPVEGIKPEVDCSGHVHLYWSSPDQSKKYKYLIYRQDVSLGSVKTESLTKNPINKTQFIDKNSLPGKEYEYAIFSRLGNVIAQQPAKVRVFVTAEIVLQRVVPVDGRVLFAWEPPQSVKRVNIYRNDELIHKATGNQFTDHGIQNEKEYKYKFISIFINASKIEIPSKGISRDVTPVSRPCLLTLDGKAPKFDGQNVILSWNLPDSQVDKILIFRQNEQITINKGESFDIEEINTFAELPGNADSYNDDQVTTGAIYYYGFYTVKGSVALYSGSLHIALLEEVKDLTLFNREDEVCLQWKWPPENSKIDFVEIIRTIVPDPSLYHIRKICKQSQEQPEEKRWNLTLEQYRKQGSMTLDNVGNRLFRYRYHIFTVRCEKDKDTKKIFHSPNGISTEVTGGRLPKITWRIKRKSKVLKAICDISQIRFPFSGLLLVKKRFEKPKDIEDGEVVASWRPQKKLIKKIVLEDDRPEYNGDTYYKVFLANHNEAGIIKVESSPMIQLKF